MIIKIINFIFFGTLIKLRFLILVFVSYFSVLFHTISVSFISFWCCVISLRFCPISFLCRATIQNQQFQFCGTLLKPRSIILVLFHVISVLFHTISVRFISFGFCFISFRSCPTSFPCRAIIKNQQFRFFWNPDKTAFYYFGIVSCHFDFVSYHFG